MYVKFEGGISREVILKNKAKKKKKYLTALVFLSIYYSFRSRPRTKLDTFTKPVLDLKNEFYPNAIILVRFIPLYF